MAAIVLACCASHVPPTAVVDEPARIRHQARERGVQAGVVLASDHVEVIPQICVGIPTGVPGHPALAGHLTRCISSAGFDAVSVRLDVDPLTLAVYRELDPDLRLPMVPIVLNCAVAPLMPVRRWYGFGRVLGAAIRDFAGLSRVAVVGAGGRSPYAGAPVGDAGLLDGRLLDRTDAEIDAVGVGAHEIRSWLTVAGAVSSFQPVGAVP
jgi:hypothetical protein